MRDISFVKSLGLFTIVLTAVSLVLYREFIFGDLYFMAKDMGSDGFLQLYPYVSARMNSWSLGEAPQWQFYNGLGENLYPFSFEPISFLVWSLFFKDTIASGFIWIQLLHTLLSGLLIFSFFRNAKLHYIPSIIGGLLYAFSGYLVAYGSWWMVEFSATATFYAFLLFSLPQALQFQRWYFYPLAVASLAIIQPINLYFIAIITALYLLKNYFQNNINDFKQFGINAGKFIVAGILGVGLASFMLWSNIYHMLSSARSATEFKAVSELGKRTIFSLGDANELLTSYFRLFSMNFSGTANNYNGWYNYFEAPIWCSSLFVLLLVPQLFHFVKGKIRLVYFGVLFMSITIALFPYFRILVWLDLGNYYRVLALLIPTVLLCLGMKSLNYVIIENKIYKKTLLITLLILIIPLLLFSKKSSDYASPTLFVIVLFLVAYGYNLYSWKRLSIGNYFPIVLLSLIVFELILFLNPVLQDRDMVNERDINGKIGYNDATKNIVNTIKAIDKSFYRIEKDFTSSTAMHYGYNDAKMQNYFSSKSYTSYTNAEYVRFLNLVGAVKNPKGTQTIWLNGLADNAIPLKLCTVKYYLSKSEDSLAVLHKDLKFMFEHNGIQAFKVNNALPLGITYNSYITKEKFLQMDSLSKQKTLLQAIVVDKEDVFKLKGLSNKNTAKTFTTIKSDSVKLWTAALRKDTLTVSSFNQNKITGNINLSKNKMMFFAIPHHKGWNVLVNKKPREISKVFGGLMGIYLERGHHDIELSFEDPYKKMGVILTIISFVFLLALIIGTSIYSKKQKIR